MGHDPYCFVCGAGFFWRDYYTPEEGDYEKPEVRLRQDFVARFNENTTAWLHESRVIGQNPNAQGSRRHYVSGPARKQSEYGSAVITKGDDPVAPGDSRDEAKSVYIYHNFHTDDETGALPVHDRCLEVLLQAHGAAQGKKLPVLGLGKEQTRDARPNPFVDLGGLDLGILFQSVAPLRRDYMSALMIDYGAFNNRIREQYWGCDRGKEPYILDPVNVQGIHGYISALPRLPTQWTEANRSEPASPASDPFARISLELLALIFLEIPQKSIVPALLASQSLSRVAKLNWFWQCRVRVDMPWMWELFSKDDVPTNTDWRAVYTQLYKDVADPLRATFLGLANRQRIWNASQQILDMYFEAYEEHTSSIRKIPKVILSQSKCHSFPCITSCDTGVPVPSTVWFHTKEVDVRSEKSLEVHWNSNGLAGMIFELPGWSAKIGAFSELDRIQQVSFDQGDWLKGIILNIKQTESRTRVVRLPQGDLAALQYKVTGMKVLKLKGADVVVGDFIGCKRILIPKCAEAIVGLKTETRGGIITRLGLLEYPMTAIAQRQKSDDPLLTKILWNDDIPFVANGYKPSLHLSDTPTKSWKNNNELDLAPVETLIFGDIPRGMSSGSSVTDNPKREAIVALSGAYNGQAFAIHRSYNTLATTILGGSIEPLDKLGPYSAYRRDQLKAFPIDGPGGERIVTVFTAETETGIRIVTSRGRQCTWGSNLSDKWRYHSALPGCFVGGIFAGFGHWSLGRANMSDLSTISVRSRSGTTEWGSGINLRDEMGRAWEPRHPPEGWKVIGEVIGKGSKDQTATFIDFARPVAKITGLYPAPEWLDVIELGGFLITYVDGETVHCGLPCMAWPKGESNPRAAAEALRDMGRHKYLHNMEQSGSNYQGLPKALEGAPHVHSDLGAISQPSEWDLTTEGERISCVTVWAREFLDGIQFHTECGKSSPRWGKCGGEPTATINAGSEEIEDEYNVKGLKILLGSYRHPYRADEVRPQGVQALGMSLQRPAQEEAV